MLIIALTIVSINIEIQCYLIYNANGLYCCTLLSPGPTLQHVFHKCHHINKRVQDNPSIFTIWHSFMRGVIYTRIHKEQPTIRRIIIKTYTCLSRCLGNMVPAAKPLPLKPYLLFSHNMHLSNMLAIMNIILKEPAPL